MFMRFVHLKVPENRAWEAREWYEERVIPALREAKGCVFAGLLQPSAGSIDELLSMTLWESQERAEAYESSGLYDALLDEIDDVLALATEWRAQLSKDHAVGPPPVKEPVVEGYPVALKGDVSVVGHEPQQKLFLRIVAARIEAGRFEELKAKYDELVLPALRATPGCRAVFLVESLQSRTRALSVTVWDSEEAAVRYEASGKFDDLAAKVSEYFSGLYLWKLSLAPAEERESVKGSDLEVSGFHIVAGRNLEE